MSKSFAEVIYNILVAIPEHQMLLSFNSDEEAMAFYGWWKAQGQKLWRMHYDAREALQASPEKSDRAIAEASE